MPTTAFCATCQRTVYVSDGEELACPVCASPLMLAESEVVRKQRIAVNEDAFRKVNQSIDKVAEASPGTGAIDFVCECGRRECQETVSVRPEEYTKVREDSSHFFVLPSHAIPDAETVIEKRSDYWIVEKTGFAKDLVEGLDERT